MWGVVGFALVYLFDDKPLNTSRSQGPLARLPNTGELGFITQDSEQAFYRLAHFLGMYSLNVETNPHYLQPPEAILKNAHLALASAPVLLASSQPRLKHLHPSGS